MLVITTARLRVCNQSYLTPNFRRILQSSYAFFPTCANHHEKLHALASNRLEERKLPKRLLDVASQFRLNPTIGCRACQGSNGSVEQIIAPSRAQLFVQSFPPRVRPYLKLSRIDRPIGTWLLFWPCTWGLTIGAEGMPSLSLLALFGTGAFIMRGAGCTINDMWDYRFDAKVRRTKDRPLASRELRLRHAAVWLTAQLSAALWILCQLNAPCFVLGVASLGLVIVYPLAKRVTNWPQVVLGFTFNMGVPMGFTAATATSLQYLEFPSFNATCALLYGSGVLWTLIYDTIYAHQDREDDAYLGLGSTARRLGENTKPWLQGFSLAMLSCLTTVGYINEFTWPFYLGVGVTASHLAWQIHTLDINSPKNCSDRFTANRHIGWLIFLSILGSYWYKSGEVVPPELLNLLGYHTQS